MRTKYTENNVKTENSVLPPQQAAITHWLKNIQNCRIEMLPLLCEWHTGAKSLSFFSVLIWFMNGNDFNSLVRLQPVIQVNRQLMRLLSREWERMRQEAALKSDLLSVYRLTWTKQAWNPESYTAERRRLLYWNGFSEYVSNWLWDFYFYPYKLRTFWIIYWSYFLF